MARPPGPEQLRARRAASALEWETRTLAVSRDLSRSGVTQWLVELADIGGWELSRTRITPDGQHSVVVKRRIIRQLRSD